MIWPVHDASSAVEFIMCISFGLVGLSHILRPRMWCDYFKDLYGHGASGIVTRTFLFEYWPALLIVSLHQVWSGPGIVITLVGWSLLFKCTLSLLEPKLGLAALTLGRKPSAYVAGGFIALAISASAGLALWSPQ